MDGRIEQAVDLCWNASAYRLKAAAYSDFLRIDLYVYAESRTDGLSLSVL